MFEGGVQGKQRFKLVDFHFTYLEVLSSFEQSSVPKNFTMVVNTS